MGLPEHEKNILARVPALHAWYGVHARKLPWRDDPAPYRVWISEAMLQQTRVSTVVDYFERWMARFPDVASLAAATEHDVLLAWEGLGYYSRARNLRKAARAVMERHGGEIPQTPEALRALPGVGPYTAAAVASIAFGVDAAVTDGNVIRVAARLLALSGDPKATGFKRRVEEFAQRLLPPGTASSHNQAMMELGATVCTPRNPGCGVCPFAPACRARGEGAPERYPERTPRTASPHYDVAVGLILRRGAVLLSRRPPEGLLGGMWELPGGKIEAGETPEAALRRELREELGLTARIERALPPVRHAYTHFKVTLHPFVCRFSAMTGGTTTDWVWARPEELNYPAKGAKTSRLEEPPQGAAPNSEPDYSEKHAKTSGLEEPLQGAAPNSEPDYSDKNAKTSRLGHPLQGQAPNSEPEIKYPVPRATRKVFEGYFGKETP